MNQKDPAHKGNALGKARRRSDLPTFVRSPRSGPDTALAIINGRTHVVRSSEAESLRSREWDIILEVNRHRIYSAFVGAWSRIAPQHCRLAFVGLRWPGEPFGNKSVAWSWDLAVLSRNTFLQYMMVLSRLVQDKGTSGPYLFRKYLGDENKFSESRYGYFFTEAANYLILSHFDLPLHNGAA